MSKEHAEIFKVLGVESRIKIIEMLKLNGPMGVNDIAEILGISPSAVSQHLKVLKYAGIVKSERKGYSIPYEINPDALFECRDMAMKVCSCCCTKEGHAHIPGCEDPADEVASLKLYEKELKKELKRVQTRIEELKTE
jgi:DNA-binding transcriptional ArsR family regulator